MWKGRWRLVVKRTPYLEKDADGNYVQKVELVEHDTTETIGRNNNRPGPQMRLAHRSV